MYLLVAGVAGVGVVLNLIFVWLVRKAHREAPLGHRGKFWVIIRVIGWAPAASC